MEDNGGHFFVEAAVSNQSFLTNGTCLSGSKGTLAVEVSHFLQDYFQLEAFRGRNMFARK